MIEYARLITKSSEGLPTIPPSASHDNGDWSSNDIYEHELYMDSLTGFTYTRHGDTIVLLSDGTGGGKNYLEIEVLNGGADPLPKMAVCYFKTSSSSANTPEVLLADNATEATSSKTMGLLKETIAPGATGKLILVGEYDLFDTSVYNVGDRLWLGTLGGIVTAPPAAPRHAVFLGIVSRSQSVNGRVCVAIQNGYELEELHNVTSTNYTTPQDEDSVLAFDETQELWKRLTLFNLYVYLKNYFDALYESVIAAGTTSQYFRGDKTWQTLDKTAVGLSNVDNTSDVNKPVSTSQQTALDTKENTANKATTMTGNTASNIVFLTAKAVYDWAVGLFQPLLVSGTNIKTVNGNSVLGSGNLTINGGLVGVHSLLFIPSASVTNQMVTGTSTLSGTLLTANAIICAPFIPSQNITTANLFMQVTTAFAGALCRIAIYSNVNSAPSSLLYVSSDLDMSTTGIKTAVTTFNFVAGTTYWLAIHGGTTGTAGVTAINSTNLIPIKASGVASSSFSVVTASSTFTSGTPSTFPSPTFASVNMPYIGITKA